MSEKVYCVNNTSNYCFPPPLSNWWYKCYVNEWLIDRSIDRSIDQLIDWLIDRWIDRSIDWLIDCDIDIDCDIYHVISPPGPQYPWVGKYLIAKLSWFLKEGNWSVRRKSPKDGYGTSEAKFNTPIGSCLVKGSISSQQALLWE